MNYYYLIQDIGLTLVAASFFWANWRNGKTSYSQQAIANLQALTAGLEKENSLIKEENTRLREEMKGQVLKHASLESDMKVLQALAQGAPAITLFEEHFNSVIEEFKKDIMSFREGQKNIIVLLEKIEKNK